MLSQLYVNKILYLKRGLFLGSLLSVVVESAYAMEQDSDGYNGRLSFLESKVADLEARTDVRLLAEVRGSLEEKDARIRSLENTIERIQQEQQGKGSLEGRLRGEIEKVSTQIGALVREFTPRIREADQVARQALGGINELRRRAKKAADHVSFLWNLWATKDKGAEWKGFDRYQVVGWSLEAIVYEFTGNGWSGHARPLTLDPDNSDLVVASGDTGGDTQRISSLLEREGQEARSRYEEERRRNDVIRTELERRIGELEGELGQTRGRILTLQTLVEQREANRTPTRQRLSSVSGGEGGDVSASVPNRRSQSPGARRTQSPGALQAQSLGKRVNFE